MMEGLQICVRMTDGISFSLSSIATVTKGLLKKTPGQREWGRGAGPETERRGTLKTCRDSGYPQPT